MNNHIMVSAFYSNKFNYYNLMHKLLMDRITALSFQKEFLSMRHQHIDEDKNSGYDDYQDSLQSLDNEKKFTTEYALVMYNSIWSKDSHDILIKYVEGARKYNVSKESFFTGLLCFFMDMFVLEYQDTNEYEDEYGDIVKPEFDPEWDVDEKTLREKMQAAYNCLTNNKDLWL